MSEENEKPTIIENETRIIDFHTHIFPDKIAAKTVSLLSNLGSVTAHTDGSVAGLKSALREANVSLAVSLPVVTKCEQFESILEFAKEVNEAEMGQKNRILSFAGIHPLCFDIEGKMRRIKESGIKGVKIHPEYQCSYFDSDDYYRVLSAARDNDLVVVTHAGVDVGYTGRQVRCTPDRVERALKRVGEVKLVLAHLGGDMLFDDVMRMKVPKSVYIDTAFNLSSVGKPQLEMLLDKFGDDRVLFATDSPWTDIFYETEILATMGLDTETEQKIFYKNALQLLDAEVLQ